MPGRCVGVAVIVMHASASGPRFLYLLRSGGRFVGQWWPVTGTLDPGESAAACARRELAEETELSPALLEPLGIEAPHENGLDHLELFAAVVDGASDVRLNAEHTEHRWCSFEEARTLAPASRSSTLEAAAQMLAQWERRAG